MKREDIIRIAREAGLHIATDVNWMPIIGIEYAERFAKQVVANIDPSSFMSWQEGYEAGATAEREACAKYVEECSLPDAYSEACLPEIADEIRARGQQ